MVSLCSSPKDFAVPPKRASYSSLFWGYSLNSKTSLSHDLITLLFHFLIAITLVIGFNSTIAQTAIVFILILALLIWTLAVRPFRSILVFLFEILSLLCIIVALAGLLYSAVQEEKGCMSCGGREGWLCWLIVIALLAALGMLLLGLLILPCVLCGSGGSYNHLDLGDSSPNDLADLDQKQQIENYNFGTRKTFLF